MILIEGAGSPAEINLSNYDIANMILAEKTNSKVLLVADIERGGCFAAIVGTIKLLPTRQRKFVEGVIINKFLGQKSILNKAITSVEKMTKKKVVGVIPKLNLIYPMKIHWIKRDRSPRIVRDILMSRLTSSHLLLGRTLT